MASRALKRLNWPYIIISGHCPNLLKPTNYFREAINDLLRISKIIGKKSIIIEEYCKHGKYSYETYRRRFGSWHKALKKAGLTAGKAQSHVTAEALFDNIRIMWERLRRQPRAEEVKKPFSMYSRQTYLRRFGGWQKALIAFVGYVNSDNEVSGESNQIESILPADRKSEKIVHKTPREISERLRFRILMRDGFTCTSCGNSPIKKRNVELHVDHILPWSKGGETEPANLTTKCAKCNLGKGNLIEKSPQPGD